MDEETFEIRPYEYTEKYLRQSVVFPRGVVMLIMDKLTTTIHRNMELEKTLKNANEYIEEKLKENIIDELWERSETTKVLPLFYFSIEELKKMKELLSENPQALKEE